MSNVADPITLAQQQLQETVDRCLGLVDVAVRDGQPVHELESGVWRQILRLGHDLLGSFFARCGNGDMGETIAGPEGQEWRRLEQLHAREYMSIFGSFKLQRTVYGSREGQKIDFVPLDNRLQLPASVYSYLLQDWSQGFCVESAFGQVSQTLKRMLGLSLSIDGLERTNVSMAQRVEAYRDDRPKPAADTEGEILVASADGKGIVMRRSAEDPAPSSHRTKGEKANKKRMAMVATVYTVDRYERTPEEVVAALFRDEQPINAVAPKRPKPCHKRVMASLTTVNAKGEEQPAVDTVHEWMINEIVERNRHEHAWKRPMVFLYDGQESLWDARDYHLPTSGVDVLDLLHVTPRLWRAAHLFHPEKSAAAEEFVRDRCLRVLQGRVDGVITGLNEMATKQGLCASKRKALAEICGYLRKNRDRMRYDEYLEKGYPIASGVIEGACRHLIKDRMERAGMHWQPEGAQAMLDVRSVHIDGDWEGYQAYRIERETRELYPHRALVAGINYTIAC